MVLKSEIEHLITFPTSIILMGTSFKQCYFCTEDLKRSPGLKAGQISLEFYQRRRKNWLFSVENIPWEVSVKEEAPNL
jgi:hypothetical protein